MAGRNPEKNTRESRRKEMRLENGREEKGEKKEKNPCATIRPLGRNVGPRQEKQTSRKPAKKIKTCGKTAKINLV